MIEVILSSGDRAEAETPAGALVAARTLMDDAARHGVYGGGRTLTAMFLVGGILVRSSVTRQDLGHV